VEEVEKRLLAEEKLKQAEEENAEYQREKEMP
jgi:hypothetical protein